MPFFSFGLDLKCVSARLEQFRQCPLSSAFFIDRLRVGEAHRTLVLPTHVNASSFCAEGPTGRSCLLEQTRISSEMRSRMPLLW